MKRTILIVAIVCALAAAGCGSENGPNATIRPSPFASDSPGPTVSPAATTDVVTASPSATGAGSTASPQAASTATPLAGAPATRESTSVACNDDPQFCSREVTMRVSGDNLAAAPVRNVTRGGSTTPNITMVSTAVAPGGDEAAIGDEVSKIHVEVAVRNTTNRTFVFAKRDVSLRVERNGEEYEVLETTGDGFEMTPDSKMLAKFDLPIIHNGSYEWAARTWFYEKT